MYDKDGSGSIELPEMIEIIGTLYEMEGVPKVNISRINLLFSFQAFIIFWLASSIISLKIFFVKLISRKKVQY